MARTKATLPGGVRLTDYLGVGVIAYHLATARPIFHGNWLSSFLRDPSALWCAMATMANSVARKRGLRPD